MQSGPQPLRIAFTSIIPLPDDKRKETGSDALSVASGSSLSSANYRCQAVKRLRYKSEPSLGTGWKVATCQAVHIANAVRQRRTESRERYQGRKAFQVSSYAPVTEDSLRSLSILPPALDDQ